MLMLGVNGLLYMLLLSFSSSKNPEEAELEDTLNQVVSYRREKLKELCTHPKVSTRKHIQCDFKDFFFRLSLSLLKKIADLYMLCKWENLMSLMLTFFAVFAVRLLV